MFCRVAAVVVGDVKTRDENSRSRVVAAAAAAAASRRRASESREVDRSHQSSPKENKRYRVKNIYIHEEGTLLSLFPNLFASFATDPAGQVLLCPVQVSVKNSDAFRKIRWKLVRKCRTVLSYHTSRVGPSHHHAHPHQNHTSRREEDCKA